MRRIVTALSLGVGLGVAAVASAADCLVMGDSIAVGVAAHLSCATSAKVGRSTKQILEAAPAHMPRLVVLSAGSNDATPSREQFEQLRKKAGKGFVVWLLPAQSAKTRKLITETAAKHQDITVGLAKVGPDGVHPTPEGYKDVARQLNAVIRFLKV